MSVVIVQATLADAEEILALQRISFARFPNYLAPQLQTLQSLQQQIVTQLVLKGLAGNVIIASVRAHVQDNACMVERLIVHPDAQRQGLASKLMTELEQRFAHIERFRLHTGVENEQSQALYKKLGFKEYKRAVVGDDSLVYMERAIRHA